MKHRSTVAFMVLVAVLAAVPQAVRDLSDLTTAAEHQVMARIWNAFLSLHAQRAVSGQEMRWVAPSATADTAAEMAGRRGNAAGRTAAPRRPIPAQEERTRFEQSRTEGLVAAEVAAARAVEHFAHAQEAEILRQVAARIPRAPQVPAELFHHVEVAGPEQPPPPPMRRTAQPDARREMAVLLARLSERGLRLKTQGGGPRAGSERSWSFEFKNVDYSKTLRVKAPGRLGCAPLPAPVLLPSYPPVTRAALEPPPASPIIES